MVSLILWFATAIGAEAQFSVPPRLTDPQISQITGEHLVTHPEGLPNGTLLITIGGTNSTPDELLGMQKAAAEQGYHSIGIDYPNQVISTACRESLDKDCFSKFRAEIVLGQPVSAVADVNATNCISHRIGALLKFLVKWDPDGHWWQFYNGQVLWDKVVVAGHSQGSGHAAYLAKVHRVRRCILVAGPQDSSKSNGTASWIKNPGQTPASEFFALLHEEDPFDSERQVNTVKDLINDPDALVVKFEDEIPPVIGAQIFVSKAKVKNPHVALVTGPFKKAWARLLRLPRN